ncbi:MAG: hypothetical protein E5W83_10385 [Mesorhizobium sp.]|nr:MAG: hypothetical protein E5W83_10385 [Mesorhizobium sp.]
MTPDDALAVEMPYPERASFRKLLSELGIRTMVDVKLTKVARRGNGLTAIFRNELTGAETSLVTSQVVIENGTIPVEEVFQDLRAGSANGGLSGVFFQDSSHDSLSVGSPNSGKFSLHRIGDAVSSRDIYSSIYEAYRLCSRL